MIAGNARKNFKPNFRQFHQTFGDSIHICSLPHFQLIMDKVVIIAFFLSKLGVIADLHYPALVENHYLVGIAHGAEAVGHYHGGFVLIEMIEIISDNFLILGIKRICSLVEEKEIRVLIHGSCYEQPLAPTGNVEIIEVVVAYYDLSPGGIVVAKDEFLQCWFATATCLQCFPERGRQYECGNFCLCDLPCRAPQSARPSNAECREARLCLKCRPRLCIRQ